MPQAPEIVAPKAPAPPAKPGAPSAFPASTGEIKVSATGAIAASPAVAPEKPATGAPTDTTPPETAKSKMFKALEDKATGKKPAAAPAVKEVAKPGDAPAEPELGPDGKPIAVDPAAPKDGKRPSPWKMVEEYKGKLSKAEAELVELRKGGVPEEAKKSFEDRITKAETRAQELEKYLHYVDYSQTDEFKTKYVEPYNKAWNTAMSEIKELTVNDAATGGERPVVANDMLQLVNAPLARARQLAVEMFGEFADDAMAHRKEIRSLFDAQNTALEDAKKNGQERLKQAQEDQSRLRTQLTESIKQDWEAENKTIQNHEKYGTYFKPREGDDQWNNGLEKGFALVDKAFSENPADPKLTPEQRKEVIRRHAAVRNRAAAWGPMRVKMEALAAQVKALTEELGQYKELEPGAGGDRKTNAPNAPGGTAKEQMMDALKKKAR